jgi:hypothetical protein
MNKFVALITVISVFSAVSSSAYAQDVKAITPAAPSAISTTVPTTTIQPSFATFISKNKNKDSALANGMMFFENNYFDKAMSEFKKSQSFGNDFIIRRWIKVTENRQKIIAAEKKKSSFEKAFKKAL